MVEAPRHLIRQPGGRVRVLRLVCDRQYCYPLRYTAYPGPGMCQRCGCTDQYGCSPPCCWVNRSKTLCSACTERLVNNG